MTRDETIQEISRVLDNATRIDRYLYRTEDGYYLSDETGGLHIPFFGADVPDDFDMRAEAEALIAELD